MNDWATKKFERAGLKFHKGRPKGDYELNDLLNLLRKFDFEINDEKSGSHIVAFHRDLKGHHLFRTGTITIARKPHCSKNRPLTKEWSVRDSWLAVSFLHEIGVIKDD